MGLKNNMMNHTMWCPQDQIAKLVNITPISLWFMVRLNNYSIHGLYINQQT